jgi:hypothetical protein
VTRGGGGYRGKRALSVDIIDLSDGRQVCQSYGVTVAAFIPGRGYVRTDARYSVTTSRHMNAFAGKDADEIAHSELWVAECIEEIEDEHICDKSEGCL